MRKNYHVEGLVKIRQKPSIYVDKYVHKSEGWGDGGYVSETIIIDSNLPQEEVEKKEGKKFERVSAKDAEKYCAYETLSFSDYFGELDNEDIIRSIEKRIEREYDIIDGRLEVWRGRSFPATKFAFYRAEEFKGYFDVKNGEFSDDGTTGKRKTYGIMTPVFWISSSKSRFITKK